MFAISRVCVPLSLDCNLHCKYCYRDKERLDSISPFSDDMISYLGKLEPTKCEAVVASGGEPLLHFDRVKELFSYVPATIHKKIMTNGTLLTQEIVDYINKNNIELLLSHDGKQSKFLRGIDVLRNETLCNLIKQVRLLRINAVVTTFNVDVWDNFFDSVKLLGRTNLYYESCILLDIPSQSFLIKDFDYNTWLTTWLQFLVSPYRRKFSWYEGKTLNIKKLRTTAPLPSFNVLPNGIVCDMAGICANYGTIHNSVSECYDKMVSLGHLDYCKKMNCTYLNQCTYHPICGSEHTRKCRGLVMDAFHSHKIMEIRDYVSNHLTDIEEKYGYYKEDIC